MGREFEIVEHKNLPGLELFFVRLLYRTPHAHSDMECCLLLEGRAEISAGGRTISLSAGDFALLRPCLAHEIRAGEGGALFLAAQVQPGLCRAYAGERALEFEFASGGERMTAPELEGFARGLLSLARCCLERPAGWEFEAVGRLNLLLGEAARRFERVPPLPGRSAQRSERVRRLLEYMEANCQRKLLLSEIAAREGLTVGYLSHFFRENFNTTFQEYLAGLRCERARTLLAEPGYSLLDVCVGSGFSDVKYLNRAFLERYGCTPREYRAGAAGSVQRPLRAAQEFFTEEQSLRLVERFGA